MFVEGHLAVLEAPRLLVQATVKRTSGAADVWSVSIRYILESVNYQNRNS